MSADVVCMSLANVPPGEQRSRFLAVGLVDNTVRIISLDPSVSNYLLIHCQRILGIKQGFQSLCPLGTGCTNTLCDVCNLCCTGLSAAIEYAGSSRPAGVSLYSGDGWSGKTR